ncbi:MAG: rhomboid family intramembrane serine protease [Akkermansiaceae bacterium]|nr:rhomboid family intramembrane serine protease [Akkermansiaceae bacterium]MCF7731569.1 rhomboid family intramembrane serine protease [Akkermansiaceae bacterium]
MRDSGWVGRLEALFRSRVAPAVALALLVLYALVAVAGGVERMSWWYLTFGLQRQEVLDGKVWQVASHALLHGNWPHVGLNGLMVWVLGARVEHVLGKAGLLKALGWGVLGGALGHLLLVVPGTDGISPLVGISGGCMALLLVITTLSPDSRMFPLPVSGRSLGLGVMFAELGFALLEPGLGLPGLSGIGGLLVRHGWGEWFQVGHACHFGGCLAGWLFARSVLRPRVTLATLRAERSRRE